MKTISAQDELEAKLPQLLRCHFPDCTRVFKRRDRLDIHLRVHTGERPYVCKIEGCGKSYARSQHLSRHIETAHSLSFDDPAKVSCPVCRRELANIYCLQKHMKAEHEEKVGPKCYECPEKDCTESFHKKKQLDNHRLQEHTDHILEAKKCHRCPHEGCDKTFAWMNLLKRHMKVHQGYPCTTEGCDKVLPNWSSLRKHIAQDHAKVFSCDECGIKFSRKPNLTQHLKRKHEESKMTFLCSVEGCGRKYDYKSNLALHMREAHEGESIWKDRPRRKPTKKPTKKISFAAALCGLDDRGKELKLLKTKGKVASEIDNKNSSEVGRQIVVEDEEQVVTSPDVVEGIAKELEQNALDPSGDLSSLEERHQDVCHPSYPNHINAQQSQEMELELEEVDHEEMSLKHKIFMGQRRTEITVIH